MLLPVADPSVLNTCRVITVDDGLLRMRAGSDLPSTSLTV